MSDWLTTTRFGVMVCEERIGERREPIVLSRPLAKQLQEALRRLTRSLARENGPVHYPSPRLSEVTSS